MPNNSLARGFREKTKFYFGVSKVRKVLLFLFIFQFIFHICSRFQSIKWANIARKSEYIILVLFIFGFLGKYFLTEIFFTIFPDDCLQNYLWCVVSVVQHPTINSNSWEPRHPGNDASQQAEIVTTCLWHGNHVLSLLTNVWIWSNSKQSFPLARRQPNS